MKYLSFLLPIAFRTLQKNRQRTFLTLLGIVVGTATLVIVLSVGTALENYIMSQLGVLSPNNVFVEVAPPENVRNANALAALNITTMDDEDFEDLKKLPNVVAQTGWYTGQSKIKHEREQKIAMLLGVSAQYPIVQNVEMEHGRFFRQSEDDRLSNVIVLGTQLADDLSNGKPTKLLDQNVKVDNKNFRVIGITTEQGGSGFFNPDDMAIIPLQTGQKKLWGIDYMQAIVLQLKDMTQVDQTVWQIKKILRNNHDIDDPAEDDFRASTFDEVMDIIGTVTVGINLLLGLIAGISLVVGGVGIMNVMYTTVTERTAEIGLRKAIGAKPKFILLQFLVEALIITTLGAIGGAIVGTFLSYVGSLGAQAAGLSWEFSFPVISIIIALIISMIIGLIFGIAPARKAAQMNAIEALQSER